MVAGPDSTGETATCSFEISPVEIEAGRPFTIKAQVSALPRRDLRGASISIRGEADAELARADLKEIGPDGYVTDEIRLTAPSRAGEHALKAALLLAGQAGDPPEVLATIPLLVRAHTAIVSAWGAPSAIAAGERFPLKVGIKCSCGCSLGGAQFRVLDQNGAEVGGGRLQDEVWPGTDALYFAEAAAEAPKDPGEYVWTVISPASEGDFPHGAGSSTFGIKVVEPPDLEVTVEAFDVDRQAPVAGAHVLLHPYRALTDERGVAKLKVAKGRYQLVVSGFRYIPHEETIEATADVNARAELRREPDQPRWSPG